MNPKYKAILDMQWPRESGRKRQPAGARAAQFAPFAALTGYEGVIHEAERLTQEPVFLTEESFQALNRTLNALRDHLDRQPGVKMTVYYDDARKAGGQFCQVEGKVRKIDQYEGRLILTDGRTIPFSRIVEIEETAE